MITAYLRRDTGDGVDEHRKAFEWGRLGLVERAAKERGLDVRRLDEWVTHPSGVPAAMGNPGGGERVEVSVEIDFDNTAEPEVEDLVDRCVSFFYDVDDGCLGRLRCAVDTTDEWRFVENLRLGIRPILEEREGKG